MKRTTRIRTTVLVGLLGMSLALYWAAQADNPVLEIVGLAATAILAVITILRP